MYVTAALAAGLGQSLSIGIGARAATAAAAAAGSHATASSWSVRLEEFDEVNATIGRILVLGAYGIHFGLVELRTEFAEHFFELFTQQVARVVGIHVLKCPLQNAELQYELKKHMFYFYNSSCSYYINEMKMMCGRVCRD